MSPFNSDHSSPLSRPFPVRQLSCAAAVHVDPMPPARSAWLPWLLLPLVVFGFAALWVLASLYSTRQCSFMAVVGAIDVLWVLGLASLRPGVRAVTVYCASLSRWAALRPVDDRSARLYAFR